MGGPVVAAAGAGRAGDPDRAGMGSAGLVIVDFTRPARDPVGRRMSRGGAMAEQPLTEQPQAITRRELLYYVWSASLALSMAGSSGAVLWFAYPRVGEGQFGGEFALTPDGIPPVDAPPQANDEGRFWLVNTRDGEWICGPAPRGLDRFVIRAEDDEGYVLVETRTGNINKDPDAGRPLAIPAGTAIIRIDTSSRILGPAHKDSCA